MYNIKFFVCEFLNFVNILGQMVSEGLRIRLGNFFNSADFADFKQIVANSNNLCYATTRIPN